MTDAGQQETTYTKPSDPPVERCLRFPSAASRGGTMVSGAVCMLLALSQAAVFLDVGPSNVVGILRADPITCLRGVSSLRPVTRHSFYHGLHLMAPALLDRLCQSGFKRYEVIRTVTHEPSPILTRGVGYAHNLGERIGSFNRWVFDTSW